MQTFTGLEYLQIDIASNFGLDKENWDTRLQWFNDNLTNLDKLIKQAEKPALFYAGVQAYRKALKGEAIGYPISLDATSSGIQILACLTGDRKAARLCNVVDTGKREDAYTGLYEIMLASIGEKAKIERKAVKQSIMTAFYGSTAMPKKVFGEGELLNIFHYTMEENAPGPWELTKTMLDIWDNKALVNEWVVPDNFHVKVKVMDGVTGTVNFLNQPFEVNYALNRPIEKGRSLGANMVHSIDGMIVREMVRRCDYNPASITQCWEIVNHMMDGGTSYEQEDDNRNMVKTLWEHYQDSGYLSARILDYLRFSNIDLVNVTDIKRLLESLPKKPFKVLSVHDCFRCLPNYGNDLRRQYNQILSDIARSNMLSFIISQILKRIVPVNKIDRNLWKDILETNYALS